MWFAASTSTRVGDIFFKARPQRAGMAATPTDDDRCSICLEQCPPWLGLRAVCCGDLNCFECAPDLFSHQTKNCPLCRAPFCLTDKQTLEYLKVHVKQGRAWALAMLGNDYREGNHGLPVAPKMGLPHQLRFASPRLCADFPHPTPGHCSSGAGARANVHLCRVGITETTWVI